MTEQLTLSPEQSHLPQAEIAQGMGYVAAAGEIQAPWLVNSEAARDVVSTGASQAGSPLEGNIHTMGYQEGYQVTEIPTALPIAQRSNRMPEDANTLRRWSDMSTDEKGMYTDTSNNAESIPFNALKPEAKQTMLAHRLFEVNARSADQGEIASASERNRLRVESGAIMQPTDLAHATKPEHLSSILSTGLVAGELLGTGSDGSAPKADRYGFNLDLSTVPESAADPEQYVDTMGNISRQAGVVLIVDRSPQSTDYQNEVGSDKFKEGTHRLIFGGVPSTEVAALAIHPPVSESGEAAHNAKQDRLASINAVLEHGQYIPVIDEHGQLALSYDDFVNRRENHQYGDFVRQEYVDDEAVTIPGGDFSF